MKKLALVAALLGAAVVARGQDLAKDVSSKDEAKVPALSTGIKDPLELEAVTGRCWREYLGAQQERRLFQRRLDDALAAEEKARAKYAAICDRVLGAHGMAGDVAAWVGSHSYYVEVQGDGTATVTASAVK